MTVDKTQCPNFEDDGVEAILTWAKARVSWSQTVYRGRGEIPVEDPRFAAWGFSWSEGCITFTELRDQNQEPAARMAAALFIFLWCQGVSASLASQLATTYVTENHILCITVEDGIRHIRMGG